LPAPERLELSVLEDLADKLLPRGIFDYFAGGADDEQTLKKVKGEIKLKKKNK